MRAFILAVAVIVSIASATPQQGRAYRPQVVAVRATPEDVYAAAARIFAEHGWAIRDRDPVAGFVVSNWMNAGYIGKEGIVHAWRVMVDPAGFRLEIDCMEVSRGGGRYPCADERHDDWINVAPRLSGEIEAEAQRLAAAHAPPAE
jgi:hypothetical protein